MSSFSRIQPENDIVAAVKGGQTELWLHPEQERGVIHGRQLWAYLRAHPGILSTCVVANDLRAIRTEGSAFYRKHFQGKIIFAWGSVKGESVPYLIEYDEQVVLYRRQLASNWHRYHPALRCK